MNNAMNSYKQTQFNTIGRAEIILALYDGAIRFLDQAEDKIKEKDMVGKGNLISKVIDIVGELDASLNMEVGGEVARSLHNFYGVCNRNLLMANLKLDLELLRNTKQNIQSIRSAFFEASQTPEAKETLKQMGPLPQAVTGSISNLTKTSAIAMKSEKIKQMEEKAKQLELVKQKMANAKTGDETMQVQMQFSNIVNTSNASPISQMVPPVPTKQPSLMNKKMALYKNLQNA